MVDMTQTPFAVEMRGITKRFPGVLANENVDFALRVGEIHALLGENGAGKSTLMNVLAGLYRQEEGEILIRGRPADLRSPRDAIARGVGMVHQHFMLAPTLTVTENILLGLNEPRFFMRLRRYEDRIAALGESFGLRVDPRAKIWQLSVGEQQRVEILKMLYRGADVLIMDEPTAVLAPQEIEDLFRVLRSMCAEGKSIVFISHKLGEVMQIADRITVLRKGKVTAAGLLPRETNPAELAQLMVGRSVLFRIEKAPLQSGPLALSVEQVTAENDKGLPALRGISLQVHAGEILGVAGVAGNGQRELAEVIAGLRPLSSGQVAIDGTDISHWSPGRRTAAGMGYIPEERMADGIVQEFTVAENLILDDHMRPPYSNGFFLDFGAIASRMAPATLMPDDPPSSRPSSCARAKTMSSASRSGI